MVKWNRIVLFVAIVAVMFGIMAATTPWILKNVTLGLDLQGGFEILYQLVPEDGRQVNDDLLKQTANVLERRISTIGVAEPDIDIEHPDRIRVKLPGVTDQNEARRLLKTEAHLTFRDENGKILLTGQDLKENGAAAGFDEIGRPIVSVKFKEAEKFAQITRQYLQRPIGIYLDEQLISNPVVQAIITNGEASIFGMESPEEAQNLANLLNAGSLPVPLKELSSNSVGATLGMMALEKTILAGYIAVAIIFLFLILYYRLPGVVGVITLVAYNYLVLLVMVLMNATLTLPGIAAFILGVGMAVDANIITAERIKDELRSGKTLLSAFRAGNRRSLATILDANLTVIIAALVLFIIGSSSIDGFAIMLILSNVLSMITNVALSRYLLGLLVRSNRFNKPFYYGVKESEISEL